MKCADCRFWKVEANGLVFEDDPFGDRHRHAPRATFELPLIVSRIRIETGDLTDMSDERPEAVANLSHRFTAWPATWGGDFCGDHVAKPEQRKSFV